VSTCVRDAVEASRSTFGEVDPAMAAESGSVRGGVAEPESEMGTSNHAMTYDPLNL
jgi:hypothetical protein